jgi:integrase
VRGNITQRGKNSFRLKFDAGRDPVTGKRNSQFHTFRGTKRQAQTKLAELIAAVDKGEYIEPNNTTVAEFVRARVDQWEAVGEISARTAQRYRQLTENQILPHLGAKVLQKLRPLDIEQWHTTLRHGGRVRGKGSLAARTLGHAHKVLGKALADAVNNELVSRNVARLRSPPKVTDTTDEMVIVRDVPGLIDKLQDSALRVPALLGLLCGLRLGEVLALRWHRIDLTAKLIQVREAMEDTKAHGIRFKPAKTKAGRRDITMPDSVVEALRTYRRDQLELRMQLGLGKLPDDALLFTDVQGEPRSLSAVSRAWSDFAERIGMPEVTFHGLRHTHASQLIDAGVDIVTISKRLGHAKPDITLRIYAHLFQKDDSKAAAAINAVLKR